MPVSRRSANDSVPQQRQLNESSRSDYVDDAASLQAGLAEVMRGTPPPSRLAGHIASAPREHDNTYPLWQGPCGEGWNGGVTQSMLIRFLSCRERFRLRYICGLAPHDKWNHRMGYGNMWHECERAHATYEKAGDANETHWHSALLRHTQDMLEQYPLQREEITRWCNTCTVQFPEYIRYWRTHPDVQNRTPIMQEQAFDMLYVLPSGRTARLRGKWDSVDLIDDAIYLQENKTKGDIERTQIERQLKFDLQTMFYLTALGGWGWKETAHVGTIGQVAPINGVRYNVVRRPFSGGKGNIRPHKATGFKEAETSEQFYERLRRDYFEDEPSYWFFRIRAEISEQELKVFQDTCLNPLLEHLCWWYDKITDKIDHGYVDYRGCPPMHYRTPFGVYSALEEGGSTEYDAFLETGSKVGLRHTDELFTELKD